MTNKTIIRAHELLGTTGQGKFKTPLDIAVTAKPRTNYKPDHLIQLEKALMDAWENKESIAASLPSRWAKTETTQYFIVWLLSQFPELKIIWSGYNEKLSKRSVTRIKQLMNEFFPDLMSRDNQTNTYFETKAGGYVLGSSPTGTQTGFGANLVIIDDLIKGFEEALSSIVQENHRDYWDSTLSQRLEPFFIDGVQYEGFTIAIGTIWGPDDIINSFHDEFRSFKIPALNSEGLSNWPERRSTKSLLEKRKNISQYFWNAMFMCEPVTRGGNVFKDDWLQVIDEPVHRIGVVSTGLFLDPASTTKKTSDNSCLISASLGSDRRLYIHSMDVYKKSVFQNIDFLENKYHLLNPASFIVEDVGFANAIVEGLNERSVPARGWTPGIRNKEARIINQLEAPLETGMILFDQSVLDNETFMEEYSRFPFSSHDDTVDCLAICAEHLFKGIGMNPFTTTDSAYFGSRYAQRNRRRRPENVIVNNTPYGTSQWVYKGDRL